MPVPLRSLPVLALTALALAWCAAPAGAKAPSARCGKGQVRVAPAGVCVKPAVVRKRVAVPATVRGDARFRRVAGRRGVRRAAALTRAASTKAVLPARAAGRRARAHAAAEGDGAWEPVVVGGVAGRQRSTVDTVEGDRPSQTATAEVEVSQVVDGVTIAVSHVSTRKIALTACPDANGIANGTTETTTLDRQTAVDGKRKAYTERRTTYRGEVTVQVNDAAAIASATYLGTVDLEFRGTGAPTRRYLGTWSKAAPLPEDPPVDYQAALKRDPAGTLAGSYRGPKGATLTQPEIDMLVTARWGFQELIEDDLRDLMRLMRDSWTTTGRCVDVTLDPPSASLASGQKQTFTAVAKAKDGTPIGGPAKAIALDATVDPEQSTMKAGEPFSLAFTMGDKDKATLLVSVTSRRGEGSAMIEIPRAGDTWDVTFAGHAVYHRTRSEAGDTDTTSDDFSWTVPFGGVRLDGGQFAAMAISQLSGTLHQSGTLGTGTYTCDGTPMSGYATIVPTAGTGGTIALRVVPFSGVVADRATEHCVRQGYGGDYGHVDTITHTDPFVAQVTITPEMLHQDDFTIPVPRGADFPANCGEGQTVTCSESADVTATLRFVRHK